MKLLTIFLKKRLFLLLFIVAHSVFSRGQSNPESTILSDSTWKVSYEDKPEFKEKDYDDADWDSTLTLFDLETVSEENFKGLFWFRKTFTVPEIYRNSIVALAVNQYGASEIYLDGKLIKKYGLVSIDPLEEEVYNPNNIPQPVYLDSSSTHVLAVRFSDAKSLKEMKSEESQISGFTLVLGDYDAIIEEFISKTVINTRVRLLLGTTFLTIAFLHLVLFLFYRKKRNNLYYALFMGCTSLFLIIPEFALSSHNPDHTEFMFGTIRYVIPFFLGAFHALLYSSFYKKPPKFVKIMLGAMLLLLLLLIFKLPFAGLFAVILSLVVFVDSFRICLVAIIKKKKGAWIIGSGVLFLLLTILGLLLAAILNSSNGLHIDGDSFIEVLIISCLVLAVLSLSISMTIYLARDISKTNTELSTKLVEVQELSEKTIEQEKEKKKILEGQKEKLELEVSERTKEIRNQKEQIEIKNKEILDSIAYAKRIQSAILPPDSLIKQQLSNSFILYKPKDIVAGDFYWMEVSKSEEQEQEKKNPLTHPDSYPDSRLSTVLIAAADCTGHGVPGAMVSVVCNNSLNRSVREFGLTDPGKILDKTRELVIQEFEKSTEDVKDGMDIALVSLEQEQEGEDSVAQNSCSKLKYAGAHNPLWIIRKGAQEIEEIKASKQPIGKYHNPQPFETHEVSLQKGDAFYIFSDGYADQFGGEKGKKFKTANLKKLFLSIQDKSMEEQKSIIDQTFEEWKGDHEQLDDVCVIGVKI